MTTVVKGRAAGIGSPQLDNPVDCSLPGYFYKGGPGGGGGVALQGYMDPPPPTPSAAMVIKSSALCPKLYQSWITE